jgi:hypothetical protein
MAIICIAPSGSTFTHFQSSDSQDEQIICNRDNGDIAVESYYTYLDSNNNPTSEKITYLRRYNQKNQQWYICTKSLDQTKYTFMPSNGAFIYNVEKEEDIVYLDEILKTLRRESDRYEPGKKSYYD